MNDETKSFAPGESCPVCGAPLTRREGSFYWRGAFYPAAYCANNNSIWPLRDEEMPPLRPSAEAGGSGGA